MQQDKKLIDEEIKDIKAVIWICCLLLNIIKDVYQKEIVIIMAE